MGQKFRNGKYLALLLILLIPVLVYAESKVFVDYNFMGNSIYNFTWANGTFFNWTVGDDYNIFDGSTLTFNSSKLSSVYYNATTSQLVAGVLDGGTLDNTKHSDANYDDVTMNFSEAAGTPGLDVRVNFTASSFNRIVFRYKSSVLKGSYPVRQLWDYDTGSWKDFHYVGESITFSVVTQPIFKNTDYVQDGIIQMRLYKASSGNTNNHYYIDWVAMVKGIGTPSGTEVDPLSYHKNENMDNSGYNITADYFFGIADNSLGGLSCSDREIAKYNSTSGNWECEADDDSGGSGSSKWVDGGTYIYPNITFANNTYASKVSSGDWTNVSITESQVSDADWWDADADVDADEISESKIAFSTVCGAGNHYYLNGNDLACEADDDTTYTAGDQNLTLVGTTFVLNNTWIDARYYNTEAELTALLDDNYAPVNYGDTWNKTYADTLYRAESWNNLTGIPHATPSNNDVTHFSLADEIYDWVIALGYSSFGASVDDTEMTAEDFGEFTCTGEEDGCTLNTGSFDDEYVELGDNFVGDVTGPYSATVVGDTAGLLWGNISGGWNLNVLWTGTLGGDNITDGTIDESELAENCVKLSELDVTDVSDNIAGDIAEGELADSIIVSADIKDGVIAEADLKVVNAPADEDIFTYEATTGDFEWHTKAEMSIGDMNDVVDDTAPQLGGNLDCNAKQLQLDSSTKLCLDGATCSKYIWYDGSNVIING